MHSLVSCLESLNRIGAKEFKSHKRFAVITLKYGWSLVPRAGLIHDRFFGFPSGHIFECFEGMVMAHLARFPKCFPSLSLKFRELSISNSEQACCALHGGRMLARSETLKGREPLRSPKKH